MSYRFQLAFSLLIIFVVGCTTLASVRDHNRENLLNLRLGMTKPEVLDLMGTRSFTTHPAKYPWNIIFPPFLLLYPLQMGSITNPYRSESSRAVDGTPVEILYYYTDRKAADDAITDDELTPLVFEEGALAGWGWSFLQHNVEHYNIELRFR